MADDHSSTSADSPFVESASRSSDHPDLEQLEQGAKILKGLRTTSDLPPHAQREALAVQAAQEREAHAIKAAEDREKIAVEAFKERELRAQESAAQRQGRAATSPERAELNKATLVVLGIAGTTSWVVLFSVGLLVSSQRY